MGGCFTKQRINPDNNLPNNVTPININRNLHVNDINQVERIIENYMNEGVNNVINNINYSENNDALAALQTIRKKTKINNYIVKKKSEKNDKKCRICFEEKGKLYNYCDCNGSIKYMHQKCLLKWIKYSKSHRCEICKKVFTKKNKIESRRKKMRRLVRGRTAERFDIYNRYTYRNENIVNNSRSVIVT